MITKSKRIGFIFTLVTVFVIGCWGVAHASTSPVLGVNPPPGALVANERPIISVELTKSPDFQIKSVEVRVDGKPHKARVPKDGTSFTVSLGSRRLSQGRHKVRARLTYVLDTTRQAQTKWAFFVDTKPPPLALANGARLYASRTTDATITAKSEAGAQVTMQLNKRPVVNRVVTNRKGKFKIYLGSLRRQNKLRLTAKDAAGNVRSVVFQVVIDKAAPAIAEIKPAPGEMVKAAAPLIDVSFLEKDSGLKSIKLWIDGKEAVVKGDDRSKRVSYAGSLLSDGTHEARVKAIDYAGWSVKKKWNFAVDSRRIVVNLAERKLYYYANSGLHRVYDVAVGMPLWPTPTGNFQIVSKLVNPGWYNPGSSWAVSMPKYIAPSPNNPLGIRAMGINAPGILIHGTSDYGSIGKAASHGCIRMRNSEIVDFFPLIDIGVPVEII